MSPLLAVLVLCAPVVGSTDAAAPTLVLPARLVAGERATLAVVDAQGKLAGGVTVDVGGVTLVTDETGRAVFHAPRKPGVVTAKLPNGTSATSTVVMGGEHPPEELIVDEVPGMVALGSRFRVGGYGFRGAADENAVTIGGHPAVVLAVSPMELVVTPGPASQAGLAELRVDVAGRTTGSFQITVVGIEMSADKQQLAPQEKARLTVRALGTWQKIELEARNLTPEVVKLRGGDAQRIKTRGGTDNVATLRLEGRRYGDYSISVRLVARPVGLPDTDAAQRHLMRALPLAPDDEMRVRIQRQIHRLERHAQDVARVRNELERILGEGTEGEFGRAVEAAWKALLKR